MSSAGSDLKSAVIASIRENNKVFFSTVVAQAQKIELVGDSLVFTFAPAHAFMRTQLDGKRSWIEQVAHQIAGRRIGIVARDGEPAPAPASVADPAAEARNAGLRARAKSEPTVQAMLDVFGGEIDQVEELE